MRNSVGMVGACLVSENLISMNQPPFLRDNCFRYEAAQELLVIVMSMMNIWNLNFQVSFQFCSPKPKALHEK